MKQSIKQKLESVIAFAMALTMALMPVNGVVPSMVSVFAADTYTLTVTYDDTVDASSIKVCDGGGADITSSLSQDTSELANGKITYTGLTSGLTYTIGADPSSEYPTGKYEVTTDQIISEASNSVALTAQTKNNVTFTVSIDHAEIDSVTLNGTVLSPSASLYTIPAGSSPTAKVIVNYTMNSGYTAPSSWNTAGKYETTVYALVSMITPAIRLIEAPKGNIAITTPTSAEYYPKDTDITVTLTLDNEAPSDVNVEYGISNSSEVGSASWRTASGSNQTYSGSLTLAETKYVWFRFVDKSDSTNTSNTESFEIKVDQTAPTVAEPFITPVVKEDEDGNKWINRDNQSTPAAIQIKATDSESGLDKIEYCWSDDTTFSGSSASAFAEGSLEKTFSIELSQNTDKKPYLVYRICDKCNNYSVDGYYKVSAIKYDFTVPTLTVKFTDETGTSLTTDKWQTGSVKVTFEVEDPDPQSANSREEKSGFDKVVVTNKSDNRVLFTGNESNLANGFELSNDGTYELEIIAYDKAGNQSETRTQTVKIDKSGITSQAVTLNPSTTTNSYAGNLTVVASAESLSGINHVVFTFHDDLTNTDVSRDITATDNKAECSFPSDVFPNGFDGTVKAALYDNTESIEPPHMVNVTGANAFRYNNNGAAIQISANSNWTKDSVPVIVTVSDKITEFQTIEFLVNDSVVKTVSSFENTHQYAGGIEISDNSLSPEGTRVTVNVTSMAGIKTTDYIYVRVDKQAPNISFSGIAEGAVYNTNRSLTVSTAENIWQGMKPVSVTATRTIDGVTTNLDLGSYAANATTTTDVKNFTEDGVYTVTATAVDAAGNQDSKSITFTIDKTAPVLSISGVSDEAYSSSPVTLNFQAIESFYETDKVTITVERKLEGSTYGSTVNFVNSGKTSNVSNTFNADGDYTITMTAVDAAGNVAATQTLTFTVDATAPVVTISGTEDYFITSQKVALQFSVVESYFETNKIQISGKRKAADGKVETLDITGWKNTGKTSSFDQEFTEDGYYTITLSSTDKAGNTKQQIMHFTIDTKAPEIDGENLSKYNGRFKSFKLDEDLEDLIKELTAPTVKMTLNGKAYDGGEITEDGKYTLLIEVMDEVGLTASQNIEFVIDNTAPKIIFAGAEDGKTYTEAVRLNLSLENENDSIVKILINGEEQELTDGKASYDFDFNTFGDYTVTVETMDEAGNPNSQSITFTYAEHKNAGYLWILIIAMLIVIGLIVVVVINSNKKRNA